MAEDKNFDPLSRRFKKNIYDTPKGQIRLEVVKRDLYRHIPEITRGGMQICDAGAGQGQLAEILAGHHNELTLVDISTEMLEEARNRIQANPAIQDVNYLQSPIQSISDHTSQQFDLVICHAVLEWVEQPREIINSVQSLVTPGGYLSLMFYNVNSLIYFNALKGNFRKALSGDYRGHPGGLTPLNPVDPVDVELWLGESGVEIISHTGVRVLYDNMPRHIRDQRSLEDMLELELILSEQTAFRLLGRYQHYLCQC